MKPARRRLLLLLLVSAWGPFPARADSASHAARIVALQPRRDEPAVEREIDKLVAEGLEVSSEDPEMLVTACRWKAWRADATSGDAKRDFGKAAWLLAERALEKRPGDPAASYCAALGIGAYSQAAGIFLALTEGLEGKYNDRLQVALDRAPDIDAGGPILAKARYHYELPWPKRDLKRAIALYRQAIAKHPLNLRTKLFLAEAELKNDEVAQAKQTLQSVLEGSIAYDPPEGRRVQRRAAEVGRRIDEAVR